MRPKSKALKAHNVITLSIINHIPHHGVINQHKPDKLRVAFDASAKYNGHS